MLCHEVQKYSYGIGHGALTQLRGCMHIVLDRVQSSSHECPQIRFRVVQGTRDLVRCVCRPLSPSHSISNVSFMHYAHLMLQDEIPVQAYVEAALTARQSIERRGAKLVLGDLPIYGAVQGATLALSYRPSSSQVRLHAFTWRLRC